MTAIAFSMMTADGHLNGVAVVCLDARYVSVLPAGCHDGAGRVPCREHP